MWIVIKYLDNNKKRRHFETSTLCEKLYPIYHHSKLATEGASDWTILHQITQTKGMDLVIASQRKTANNHMINDVSLVNNSPFCDWMQKTPV